MLRPAADAVVGVRVDRGKNVTRLNIYEFLRSLISMMDDARAGDAYFRRPHNRCTR